MNLYKSTRERKMIYLAQTKMSKLFQLVQFLQKERSIDDIAMNLDMSTRTAYRYLHMLDWMGVHIEKSFSDRFFIAMDTCPICGKNVEENNIEHESTGEEREASPRAPENLVATGQDDNAEPSFKDVEDLKAGSVYLPIETRLSPNANR